MSNEIYPVFWRHKPLIPGSDEVVLRVESKGFSSRFHGEGEFTSSCEGSVFLFDVVDVLRGDFADKEIAIAPPSAGELYDLPKAGEQRIVVGRVLPLIRINERWVDNRAEAQDLFEAGASRQDAFMREADRVKVAGPSTVRVLDFRAPVELPAVIVATTVFVRWDDLPPVWRLGLPAAGFGMVAGVVWLTRALLRRRKRRA